MKTVLSGSVREDRQAETDDPRPRDFLVFLCSWKEPHVATSGWAYLKAEEGQGLEGRRTETKGDLSEQTKQKLAGYWQAKQRESSIHGFCRCFVPHQLLKTTPHRESREFYFTVNNLWFASVYSGCREWFDDTFETPKGDVHDLKKTKKQKNNDVRFWNIKLFPRRKLSEICSE